MPTSDRERRDRRSDRVDPDLIPRTRVGEVDLADLLTTGKITTAGASPLLAAATATETSVTTSGAMAAGRTTVITDRRG